MWESLCGSAATDKAWHPERYDIGLLYRHSSDKWKVKIVTGWRDLATCKMLNIGPNTGLAGSITYPFCSPFLLLPRKSVKPRPTPEEWIFVRGAKHNRGESRRSGGVGTRVRMAWIIKRVHQGFPAARSGRLNLRGELRGLPRQGLRMQGASPPKIQPRMDPAWLRRRRD
jgi:hypothetical protein